MSILDHCVAELKEGASTFLQGVAATAMLALALGAWVLVASILPDPKLTAADKLASLLVIPIYVLVQSAWLGAMVGLVAVLLRIAGAAALFPLVLGPAGGALAWFLGFGFISSAWDALTLAVGARSAELSGGGMGSCGSPAVLLVIVPILLIHYLAAPKILFAILWFVLVAAGFLVAGVAAGIATSLPPLMLAVADRLRDRARARQAAAAAPAPAAPA